jgi:hypothetical protein
MQATDWYFTCETEPTPGCVGLMCGHYIAREELDDTDAEYAGLVMNNDVGPEYSQLFACNVCHAIICKITFGDLTQHHISSLITCAYRRRQ